MVSLRPFRSVSSRISLISRILPALTSSVILSITASTVVVGGMCVMSMQLLALSYRHVARTRTLPRPFSKTFFISAASYKMVPPPTKSGAGSSCIRSAFSSFIRAMVALQSSTRLNEQMLDAMPTAMPRVLLARIVGKVTGSSVGSVVVPS